MDVVMTTFHNWKSIVISVGICVAIALIYIFTTNPKFSRTSQVLITNSSSGRTVSAQMAAMAGMGLLGGNSLLDDEIAKMASYDVLREVVRRLDLNMSYKEWGLLKNKPLYGKKRPILVSMPDVKEKEGVFMDIKVDADGNVTIKNLEFSEDKDPRYDEVEKLGKLHLKLGESVKTPLGDITVTKGPGYKEGEDYDIEFAHPKMEVCIQNLYTPLVVEARSKNGSTVDLQYADIDIDRAEDVLREIVNIYTDNEIKQRNHIIDITNDFIDERLARVSKELGDAETEYYDFRSKNYMTDQQKALELYMEKNKDLETSIQSAMVQKEIVGMMREHLLDATRKNELLPLNTGVGGEGIEDAIAAYNTKLVGRNRLANNSSDSHPKVVQADAELANTRAQILTSIDNYLGTISTRLASLRQQQNKAVAAIQGVPKRTQEIVDIARTKNIKESLYLYLLQKREENSMSLLNNQMTPQVIQEPFGFSKPVAPRKLLTLAISFVLGFIIPFLLTLGKEVLNSNARDKSNLDRLGLGVIADIPALRGKGLKKLSKKERSNGPGQVVEKGAANPVNEAFRMLRTNIAGSKSKNGAEVVLVTSMAKDSGKTFVAMNLAQALELGGRRTLVVDCDLRKGTLSNAMGRTAKGLENLTVTQVKDTDFIAKGTRNEAPDVIPVLNLPESPTELLDDRRMAELFDNLRSQYDIILIDSPDIGKTADANILARYADRTLLVLREGSIGVSMIGKLRKLTQEDIFPDMQVVLNECS